MEREVRVLSAAQWDAICATWAAAPAPHAHDSGVQDAATGRTLTPAEYQAKVEPARRERHHAATSA